MALPSRPLGGQPTPAPAAPLNSESPEPVLPEPALPDLALPDLELFTAPTPAPVAARAEEPQQESAPLPEPAVLVNPFESAAPAAAPESSLPDFSDLPELPELGFDDLELPEELTAEPAAELPLDDWDTALPEGALPVELPADGFGLGGGIEEDFDVDALFAEPEPVAETLVEPTFPEAVVEPEPEMNFDEMFSEPNAEPAASEDEYPDFGEMDGDSWDDEIVPPEPPVLPEAEEPESWDKDFDSFMEDNETEATDGDLTEELDFDEEELEAEASKPLSKGKSKGSKKKPNRGKPSGNQGLFGRFSNSIFSFLSSIPFIGGIFKPLLKIAGIATIVLLLLPFVAIPFIIFTMALGTVPAFVPATGPDNSSAVLNNLSYKDGMISGTVQNTGEIIANVVPTVSLWTYNPFGGGWLEFNRVAECEGDEISVDIDSSFDFSIACSGELIGIDTKVSGELAF